MTEGVFSMRPTRRHLIAGAAGLALSACSRSGQALNSADAHAADYPTVRGVEAMAGMVSERTDGRINIRVFPGGQLGSERDTLELTIFGGLDLNRVNMAPLNSFAPETIVPSLPFLFRSINHMRAALDGSPGERILAALEPHGLIGLCFYDSGARGFYNTRRPIETPEDLEGLKIRVPNSNLYVAMVEALGGNPTPMSLGEAYQGLVQGVIDGAENNWPSYEGMGHFEAARYFSMTRHVIAPEVLVMSARSWNRYSAQDQSIIRQAARDSVPIMRELWDARVSAARERVIAAGVVANEVGDTTAFADRMQAVWSRFIQTSAQAQLVDDIRAVGAT